ncbi:MAG: hypothetical protein JO051_03355 [Acidobacteriaceae bacterium]|nr:hypothetical protein [Acidobacteriaceae bacterium]
MSRAKVIRPPKSLPKAKQLESMDWNVIDATITRVTTLERKQIDAERLGERLDHFDAMLTDTRKDVAQIKSTAEYWAGISQRVKELEEAPPPKPTVVLEEAEALSIWWVFAVNDAVLALWFMIWWNWPTIFAWFSTFAK